MTESIPGPDLSLLIQDWVRSTDVSAEEHRTQLALIFQAVSVLLHPLLFCEAPELDSLWVQKRKTDDNPFSFVLYECKNLIGRLTKAHIRQKNPILYAALHNRKKRLKHSIDAAKYNRLVPTLEEKNTQLLALFKDNPIIADVTKLSRLEAERHKRTQRATL